jgi:hypothetical protein
MAWRGFYTESREYIAPRTLREEVSFWAGFPRAFISFYWLTVSYNVKLFLRRIYYGLHATKR